MSNITIHTGDAPVAVNTAAAAKALGVSVNWLKADRRSTKPRIPFIKLGPRRVLYSLDRCREALVAFEVGGNAPKAEPK
jgi:hypothetical protein